MKKNWIAKVAVLMLALVMVTSCFVGGTFAKYVTKAEGTDTARVAKWGVLLTVDGNAFANQYPATDEAYLEAGGEYSVVASDGAQVVAPGTGSDQLEDHLIATVSGTPEVATRYTLKGEAVQDIVLKKGTGYTDYTQLVYTEPVVDDEGNVTTPGSYGYTGTFDLDKDYAPVKWDLKIAKNNGTPVSLVELLYANLPEANLAQAEAYGLTPYGCSIFDAVVIIKKVAGNEGYQNIVDSALGQVVSGGRNFQLKVEGETFELSYDFDPNKEMNFSFELTWKWLFEQEDVALYDKADTYLGNVAAEVISDDNANTVIAATLTATATQID